MTDLAISEVFGPTVQGEGPSLGRRAAFVRTARCNLSCRWCDTPFTWDWKGLLGTTYDPAVEIHPRTVADVADQVLAMHVPLAVLTGGEPLLQATALTALAGRLVAEGMRVEVETNGTRRPPDDMLPLVRFNVSPKLANSGDPLDRRIKPDVLAWLAGLHGTAFKFVVTDGADIAEVAGLVRELGLPPDQVWIMAEGVDPAKVLATTATYANQVVANGWNLTTRLHVLAWGNERGR